MNEDTDYDEELAVSLISEDEYYLTVQNFSDIAENISMFEDLNADHKISTREIVMAVIYGSVAVYGLCSNFYVLKLVGYAFVYGSHKVCSVLVYITVLTVLNMIILMGMPFSIADFIMGYWPFTKSLCYLHWMLESMNKMMTSVVLSMLTVACYCAVCQPRMKKMYRSKTWSCVTVSIGFGIILALARSAIKHVNIYYFVLKYGGMQKAFGRKCLFHPTNTDDTFNFMLCSLLCGYAIPVASMIFSYGSILYSVTAKITLRQRRLSRLKRVARPVFGLLCFYLLSWTPYWTVTFVLYKRTDNGEQHPPQEPFSLLTIAFVVHLLPYLNCATSTLLYSFFNSEMRLAKGGRRPIRI